MASKRWLEFAKQPFLIMSFVFDWKKSPIESDADAADARPLSRRFSFRSSAADFANRDEFRSENEFRDF